MINTYYLNLKSNLCTGYCWVCGVYPSIGYFEARQEEVIWGYFCSEECKTILMFKYV